jgi:hypothetical protein
MRDIAINPDSWQLPERPRRYPQWDGASTDSPKESLVRTQPSWLMFVNYASDSNFRGEFTMRGLLVLIGLIAIAVVVLMSLGMLKITQSTSGSLPSVAFDMKGGKLPTIQAETGSVGIGTTNTTVSMPTVEMTNTTVTLPTIEVKQAPGASPTPAAK